MKIKYNGKQITEQEDKMLVDKYFKTNTLVLVLTLSILLLGFGAYNSSRAAQNESAELTRHDLGELKGMFNIFPVKMDESYKTERASYAYHLSGGDEDFVMMLNAECGSWACGLHDLKYERQGELWSDFGLCGISTYYHTEKYLEAKSGTWKDQIRICYDLYNKGTRFYGWDKRYERWTGRFSGVWVQLSDSRQCDNSYSSVTGNCYYPEVATKTKLTF